MGQKKEPTRKGPRSKADATTVVELISAAGKAKEMFENLSDAGLPQAERAIGKLTSISDDKKKYLQDKVRNVRAMINPKLVALQRFNSLFEANDELQKFADLYGEYNDMREATKDMPIQLQRTLTELGIALQNQGAEVPILGEILAGYGAIAVGLVEATEKIRKDLVANMQGHVGVGAIPGDTRQAALLAQYPELANKHDFAPQGPNFVFRPVEGAFPLLIWDEGTSKWYVVRQEASAYNDVEVIYRDSLIYCKNPLTGYQLYRLTLSPTFEKIAQLRKTAVAIRAYLTAVLFTNPDYGLITKVNNEADKKVPLPSHDENKFRGLFSLDYRFRVKVWAHFKAIFDGFDAARRPDLALKIKQAVIRWGGQEAESWMLSGSQEWVRSIQFKDHIFVSGPEHSGLTVYFSIDAVLKKQVDGSIQASLRNLRVGDYDGSQQQLIQGKNYSQLSLSFWIDRITVGEYTDPTGLGPGYSIVTVVLRDKLSGTIPGSGKPAPPPWSFSVEHKSPHSAWIDFRYGEFPELLGLKKYAASAEPVTFTYPTGGKTESQATLQIAVQTVTGSPLSGVQVSARRAGIRSAPVVRGASDVRGTATLTLADVGRYQVEATHRGYQTAITQVDVTSRSPKQVSLILKPSGETTPPGPVQGSFAGDWDVSYYNDASGTGQPNLKQRMRIQVGRSTATGSVLEGRGWQPYCSGPLTENGRVWNAKHLVQNMVMQRFDNVKLAADGNSFRGTWSGMEPHQFAWIGTRVAATEHPTPPPEVPSVKPPQPPAVHAPSAVNVELSNSQRQANVTVAPGGVITLKVATYAGTGYRLNVVSPPQKSAALISGPTDEPMSRPGGTGKGKMLVGAGTWKVYKYQASRMATNTFDIVCQFSRSGQRAELEYRLTVHVK